MMPSCDIRCGDAREVLKTLADESVQCIVTSPPYFGLRDYKVNGQVGLERTPVEYVQSLVEIFSEAKRVLKSDGVCWINLGDCYASAAGGYDKNNANKGNLGQAICEKTRSAVLSHKNRRLPPGFKPKDLIGIPWMVAFALRDAGWYLRQDIIWAKRNCMPESVTDRCTRSHEYIFMLTKNAKYFYDGASIKEPAIYDLDGTGTVARKARQREDSKSMVTPERNGMRPAGFKDAEKFNGKNGKQRGHSRRHEGFNERWDQMDRVEQCTGMRNKRDVWTTATAQFPDGHFATFPPELIKPCVMAGSRQGDTVLDMFFGSGTTGLVALELGRHCIGIELNPEYVEMARRRTSITPGLPL